MAAFRNDGTVQYGSKVLAIGTLAAGNPPTISASVNYIADNISISRPSTTIVRTSEIGEPNGQVSFIGEVATGSATVQLATGSIIPPYHGDGFTLTVFDTDGDGDLDAEFFYIDSVSQPYASTGETKVEITFRKILATT